MFYLFFKQLVGYSLSIFFKKIQFIDKENLPDKGPVIIVANHPSAVIDPIIIATKIKGELSYIAAAEWFGKGIKNKIFRNQFNMIPVYRPWIEKSKKKSNNRMFEASTKSLNDGNRIIIFPEGTSVTCDYIRELKTGTARMKLDYESHPDSDKPLSIIPIGLNYSNAHQFYSSVTVKVGKAIKFENVSTENVSQDDFQAIAKALSDEIQTAMEGTLINIKPGENAELIKSAIAVLDSSNFEKNQRLAKNINTIKQDKEMLLFKESLFEFQQNIKKLELPYDFSKSTSLFKSILILLLLSPIYLLFISTFGIPMLLAKFVFNQFINDKIDEEYQAEKLNTSFKGSLVFLSGMGIMVLWMIITYLLLGIFFDQWLMGLLIFVLAYPIIKFGLSIHYKIGQFFVHLKVKKVRKNDPLLFEKLSTQKIELIQYIEQFLL